MDQYVSWCLPPEDLSLDVIWAKFEDFCKPQINEVRARFDLLTGFRQGNHSVKFVSNTINDSNIDLDKFCASKVRQLAKKMESLKSTARHIKADASDPQVAQVNLMRHQRTDLPSKAKQKQNSHKFKSKESQEVFR